MGELRLVIGRWSVRSPLRDAASAFSERHPQVALDDSLALTDTVEIEHSHGDTRA
jgi:hypothetical protein